MKGKYRRALFVFVGVILLIALIDSLGVFDKKHYFEVPHGSHTHYVAKDRDPNVPIGQFPTRRPGPGERITAQGQVVRTQ